MLRSLARSRRSRIGQDSDDRGFTLVELLVVVLIIGILAAIAIPVFLGQQASAQDAAAKHDLTNVRKAAVSYSLTRQGSFVGATATTLKPHGGTFTSTSTSVKKATATVFCATSVGGNRASWRVTATAPPAKGAC